MILYGPEGAEQGALALQLATAWMCLTPHGGVACGSCVACAAFSRGNAVDFLTIEPSPPSQVIRVERIRRAVGSDENELSVIEFLRSAPMVASAKVVLISDAHRMNPSARNALLKTLEEPPTYGKFVLTTRSIGGIASTVLSRCLAVQCAAPGTGGLAEKAVFAPKEPWLLAQGSVADGEGLKLQGNTYADLWGFASRLQTMQTGEALVASDRFREICQELANGRDPSWRVCYSEGLEALASYFVTCGQSSATWITKLVDAHRRIVGNGSQSQVIDALFTSLIGDKP